MPRRWPPYLRGRLHALAAGRFGAGRPAVALQLVQAGHRLSTFARRQADLVAAGWRVVFAEQERSLSAPFPVADGEVTLVGRIDRIDYSAAANVVRVIDYKTGDTATPPDRAHQRAGEWTDLQLPLYRHLWRSAVPEGTVPETAEVALCYFQIPNDPRTVERCPPSGTGSFRRGRRREGRPDREERSSGPTGRLRTSSSLAICPDNQHAPGMDAEEEGELWRPVLGTSRRASAGSGETFRLTNRYITLSPTAYRRRPSALTFTRKAAGESSTASSGVW